MELVYNSLLGRFQGTSGLENVPITRKRQYFGMIESYRHTNGFSLKSEHTERHIFWRWLFLKIYNNSNAI